MRLSTLDAAVLYRPTAAEVDGADGGERMQREASTDGLECEERSDSFSSAPATDSLLHKQHLDLRLCFRVK